MPVVDCQVHLHNRTYFDAHLGRHAPPYAEQNNGGYLFHTSDGSSTPIPEHYFEAERQVEELGAVGIDVLVSSMGAFNVDHLPTDQAQDLAMQLNEERADLERAFAGRFYGLGLLPMQDAHAAIATLEHAVGTLGLRGVCICSNVLGESIAAPSLNPLYRRIADLGVPVFLHPTSTVLEPKLRRFGHEYTVGFMVDSTIAALDLIFSGVLDDNPTLKVVHPHLGGVLPYLARRVDHEYAKPWANTEALERPPSEYLDRFYTDVVSLNPWALRACVEIYGPDRLLFASDYPYWAPDPTLDLVRAELDADVQDAVFFRNSAALLGLRDAG